MIDATPPAHPNESLLAARAREVDDADLARTYFWQGELLALGRFLPEAVVDDLVGDVSRVRRAAVRRTLPGYKQSASIAWPELRHGAPSIAALFHSPSFTGLLERIIDAPLQPAPDWDPHAAAVYCYDRPGDGIGYHYDTSWYRGARYTVLVGLVNRSSALLACDLHTREPHRPRRRLDVATDPGTVVVFHGDKIWHRVTPLAEGEERTVLTLQYVTDPRMSARGRAVSFAKDAVGYFGVRQAAGALPPRGSRRLRALPGRRTRQHGAPRPPPPAADPVDLLRARRQPP